MSHVSQLHEPREHSLRCSRRAEVGDVSRPSRIRVVGRREVSVVGVARVAALGEVVWCGDVSRRRYATFDRKVYQANVSRSTANPRGITATKST